MKAILVAPPPDCGAILPGFTFADRYEIVAPAGLDAIIATRAAFDHAPGWIRFLMALRNRICALAGLKPAPSTDFPVIRQSPSEVVLGFDDGHLDFRILVRRDETTLSIATLVRCHNVWGRGYLRLIMPFHRIIVARMLEGALLE